MLALNHRYNYNLRKITIEDYQYCDFDENAINSRFNGLNTSCVLEYRMVEEELEDSEAAVLKYYKDVLLIWFTPRNIGTIGNIRSFMERWKTYGQVYEDRYVARNGYYEYSNMMSDGSATNKLSVSLRNDLDKSNIQVTTNKTIKWGPYLGPIRPYRPGYTYENVVDALEADIQQNVSQDYKFELQYNTERIFDGFFYLTPQIREILAGNNNEIDIDRSVLSTIRDWNGGNSMQITVPQLMKQILRGFRKRFDEHVELMSNV